MVNASTALPLLWSREGTGITAPVVGDDDVYWGDGSSKVLCLALEDGKVRWATDLGRDSLAWLARIGACVIARDNSLSGSRLTWLRRQDGVMVRQVELPEVRSSACSDEAIALLVPETVGTRDIPWQVLILDSNGRETVRFSVGRGAHALNLVGGHLIVSFERAVACYDLAGVRVWQFAGAASDVARCGVLAQTKDGGLTCLDSASGAVRWTTGAARGSASTRRGRPIPSRPSLGGDLVIVLDRTNGAVNALDLETGAKRWSSAMDLGEAASDRARVLTHGVAVVDGGGRLRLLSRATGQVERVATVRSIWGLDAFDATDRHIALIHHAKAGGTHLQVFDVSAPARSVRTTTAAAPTPTLTSSPSLAARMRAWGELFAKRSDVRILEWSTREGTGEGLTFPPRTPPEVRAFAEEMLAITIHWAFADEATPASGGRLRLALDPVLDIELRATRGDPTFASVQDRACGIDRASEEGIGLLFAEPRKKHATMAFGHASDDAVIRFESFEAYLTLGARSAFGWYWQTQSVDARACVARLRAASMDPNTPPATLVASLVARGASTEMAKCLVDWLKEDVVLLLPLKGLDHAASSARG